MKPTPLRKIFLSLSFVFFTHLAFSQYWQQQVNYVIDVRLNDQQNELDGFEKITYINNSPDTLQFIWFHLWPNAYKNDKTAFSDQLLKNGNTKFYFSSKEEKGYINRLDFKVNGTSAKMEDHPNHIDIVKLILPKPLPPSQQVTITTPFHIKLPFNFSRGGYNNQSYQVTQWYPKPAVYDRRGWHDMPYLDQGEFYSEFGNYDVRITLPENYVVAATGELHGEDGKPIKEKNYTQLELNSENAKKGSKTAALNTILKKENFPPSSANNKTVSFKQDNIHDFAWFADKRFLVDHDTVVLSPGKVVDVYNFYLTRFKDGKTYNNPGIDYAKDAIRFYSNEVGEYPYNTMSIVEAPLGFAGGMEYPTITAIAPIISLKQFDIVIAHEIGHNWFYGILASNERKYPWMDEGINSFYEKKYAEAKYGRQPQLEELLLQTKMIQKTDQPIKTPSDSLSTLNYFTVAYQKSGRWMQLLEEQYGKDSFREKMQAYFQEWKFKHPYPEDFQKSITGKTGTPDSNFVYLARKGSLPNQQLQGTSFISIFKKNSFKNYLQQPTKNAVIILPAIGVNSYDKLMLGALVTNYKLPPSKFQFLVAPLYATGSKQFNGIGKLSYSAFSEKKIRVTEFFLNGANFSMNQFTGSSGKKFFTQFQKLVPGIKLTFKEKDPLSTVKKYVQWKSYFINDEGFRFGTDTIVTGSDTSYAEAILVKKESRVVNQLQFVYQNTRALYPFDFNFTIDQVEDLIRPAFTANYFFNYAQNGGLEVRLFAGKIFYANGRNQLKSFSTDRYHLNMTGANGYEDYTYSNYFLGRNKFDGFASQQIMMRDGGFKFRTDLLGDKVGKTDRWLAALNFSSTVPEKINPLSVLPVKIPLRVFADVGTYAEAWDRNQEGDRFLFDAGLQLSLLKETINIYIPLVYSKVYSEYYKSYLSDKRFLKNISFTINLNNSFFKKLHHEVDF